MRRMIVSNLFVVALTAIADVSISNVKVEPISPWGKVCVRFNVDGLLPDRSDEACLAISMSNRTTHVVTYASASALTGDKMLRIGSHCNVWDLVKDGLSSTNLLADFRIVYVSPDPLYQVIDLSDGPTATSYPVTSLPEIPAGGWSDDYKTRKIVLRRIKAGSFIMGDDQNDETHRVTLTKSFYVGVFEVTQRQWELVMGSRPSQFGGADYASRPVECVTYEMIRGSSKGKGWPKSSTVDEGSFLGVLRKKTGINFDLPTEAQWEYACRAGTTSAYSYGEDADAAYMWFHDRPPYETHCAGTKCPNQWGLYDMHGNVWEWCLDWTGDLLYGTDPKGVSSGNCRMRRGGGWNTFDVWCTSAKRYSFGTSSGNADDGFRLVMTLSY